MQTTIIIPTYNEKDNISIIINKIKNQKLRDINLLVVDGNSPDKTAEIVKKLQKKYKTLYLTQQEKKGLGSAYIKGFTYAINNLKSDRIIMMDADLSHDPNEIVNFISCLEKGYDFVIGSRYIKGGSIPEWDIVRKLISRSANLFLRFLLNPRIHDYTSGYRAFNTLVFKKINKKYLYLKGYAFQVSLLNEFRKNNAKIKEIPIIFHDRKHGKSKLGIKDAIEFLFYLFKLRY